ncbi:MAG: hypothetical protein RLZZ608_963 [Actinomycetota bacterium]|jgi:DhnA family fructose-bisphosphate aldolase class Ia
MSLDFTGLRNLRATDPAALQAILAGRTRRPLAAGDGQLFIIAADHPARGALGVRGDRLAMADRYDLLARLATALENPLVDGVLGTPDIVDDLAALGLLEGKIVVGSMNRGGLRGSSFEMDDRFTAYSVDSLIEARLDMAKLLVRIDLTDPGSVATLEASGAAVSLASAAQLPILIEPFISHRVDGGVVNDLTTDAVIHSVAISSALGSSSAYSWLKLPVVPDMERVMAATTLPTLLLGGDPDEDAEETFESWSRALALPGVRGLVVGRTLLYPADGDVAAAVAIAAELVHGPITVVR